MLAAAAQVTPAGPSVGCETMRHVRPWARYAAVAICVAAFVAALWHAPSAFDRANTDARTLGNETALDRALGASHDIDKNFLVKARELVPPTATYAIVTGPKVQPSNPNTLTALQPYTAYWLLPRARVDDPKQADWILSYGSDPNSLGLNLERVVELSPGLAIAQVAPK